MVYCWPSTIYFQVLLLIFNMLSFPHTNRAFVTPNHWTAWYSFHGAFYDATLKLCWLAGHLLELCFDCCDEDVGFSCLMEKLVAGAASSELLVKYMIQDVSILIVMTLPHACGIIIIQDIHLQAGGVHCRKFCMSLSCTGYLLEQCWNFTQVILLALKSASHCPAMPTSFLVWKPF